MGVSMIIILRGEKRIDEILTQEKKSIKKESELGKNWQEKRLAIGTFYSYSFSDSIGSFHLKSPEEIERSLDLDGIIVFINAKQRS